MNIIYTILLIAICLVVGMISILTIGEIFVKSYPNSKFTKWWRDNIIYEEPNK